MKGVAIFLYCNSNRMNKKRIIFVFSLILIMFLLFNLILSNSNFAVDNFVEAAKTQTQSADEVRDVLGAILNIVKIVSAGVATIMLIALSIKYMYSSVAERAEIKKHAVVFVIGCVIIFGATEIVNILAKISSNVKG